MAIVLTTLVTLFGLGAVWVNCFAETAAKENMAAASVRSRLKLFRAWQARESGKVVASRHVVHV